MSGDITLGRLRPVRGLRRIERSRAGTSERRHRTTIPASGLEELDPSIRPQDDLFRHVNGKWIERTEIPADKARYGSFYAARRGGREGRARHHRRGAAAPSPAPRSASSATSTRASWTRSASRSSAATPLDAAAGRGRRRSTRSTRSLATPRAARARRASAASSSSSSTTTRATPSATSSFVEQGGLGLPDESLLPRGEVRRHPRRVPRATSSGCSTLAGLDDAGGRAPPASSTSRPRSPRGTGTTSHPATARRPTTCWRWAEVLAAGVRPRPPGSRAPRRAGSGAFDEVVVRAAELRRGARRRCSSTERLDAWRDWLRWQVIRSAAPYLSSEFVDANFDFYGKTLTGTPELRARWKRGVSLVEGAMGEAVGTDLRRAALPAGGEGERWTCSSPTWSRRTARASPSSTG